jgi:dihydrodipicolinate synthase/N-acetylneuraminate lyase
MRFEGIIPAATTPFEPSGAVDDTALAGNVRALLDAGVHGIVGTGTMGEAGSMNAAERRHVIETIAGEVDGAVPVIAGVSSGSATASLSLARSAVEGGAGAIMLLPPLGYRADLAELIAFYGAVAEGAEVPVMLYNNPEASGVDLSASMIAAIAEAVPGVVAVKECSGDARRIPALLAAAPRLEVLVGGDDWALEGFCGGATGWVSGVAVVAPRECIALYEHCRAGELEPAREIYRRLLPLARFDMTPKLVQYFKAAQDEAGLAGGPCREPRQPLTQQERAGLAEALAVLREGVPA